MIPASTSRLSRSETTLGWAPVLALHLGPGDAVANTAFQVVVPELDPAGLVAAAWDEEAFAWRRVELSAVAGGAQMLLARLGVVVVARPDAAPQAPALPAIGSLLPGVAPVPVPVSASARMLPAPTVLFMQPDARSDVSVNLEQAPPLPS